MSRFTSIFLLGVFLLSLTTSVFSQNKLMVYDAPEGSLLNNNFSVQERIQGEKWQDMSGNVTFCNVKNNGDRANLSIISGYKQERQVKNITFENHKINGVYIHDDMEGKPAWYKSSDMVRFFVG